jgi:hypothetical protein
LCYALGVRITDNEINALDILAVHVVDSIASTAANTDYFYYR